MNLFCKAIFAGSLIGMGDIVLLSLENKVLASMLFSLGLLTIVKLSLPLYTGRIGFMNHKLNEYAKMLIGNFVGAMTITAMGLGYNISLKDKAVEVAEIKFHHGYLEMFLAGMLCGMLMYVAVNGNQVITVFAIMAFILCGFEHCIADVPYTLFVPIAIGIPKLGIIVAGNSIGAISLKLLHRSDANEICKDC